MAQPSCSVRAPGSRLAKHIAAPVPRFAPLDSRDGLLVAELRGEEEEEPGLESTGRARHERQVATSCPRAGLSLSSGKGTGSSDVSWRRLRDRGWHSGPPQGTAPGEGLDTSPRGEVTRRALPRKVPAATKGPHLAPHQSPTFRGSHSPEGGGGCGWRGSQAAGAEPACSGHSPSPAGLPAPLSRRYSGAPPHFQALPCLNPAGSALVR